MQHLKKILKKRLDNAERIAILAVGSELRADDAAGLLVAKKLSQKLAHLDGRIKIILGETAPENFTGEIRTYKPTHLIILDCAECGLEPGTIQFIDSENVGGISFSTHMLPLKLMVDYLLSDNHIEVMIIGIQPEVLEFGQPVSAKIKKTINSLANALSKEINLIYSQN